MDIETPPEFLISDFNDPIKAIVSSTYPYLLQNYSNANFLKSRAILASRIETVEEINEHILFLIPGTYLYIFTQFIYIMFVLYV